MRIRIIVTLCLAAVIAASAIAAPIAGAGVNPRAAKQGRANKGDSKPSWWGQKPEELRGGFAGKVAALDNASITVSTPKQQKTFTINEQTKIRVRGEKATLADIKVGDPVMVNVEPGQTVALAIRVPKPAAEGAIASIEGNVLTLNSENSSFTVTVPETAKVMARDKYPATFADLRVGYKVRAFGEMADNKMTANMIHFQPALIKGTVSAVNGNAITVLTVKQKTINVTADAKTMVLVRPRTADNRPGTLADVIAGAAVNIGGHMDNGSMQAMFIDVLVGGN